MITTHTLGILMLAVALIGGAVDTSALTLGRVRGAAMLGQSLEVTVPLQFGPDEDATQTCFESDVFYGDVRQESSTTALTNGGQTSSVRIRAHVRVDEPVVTVYLKSTCGQKTSRRYVLLADLASDVAPAQAVIAPAQVPLVAEPPRVATPEKSTGAPNSGVVPDNVAKIRRSPARDVNAAPVPGSAKVARAPRQSPETGLKPRLKLVPLDMSAERDPMLRSTNELLSLPSEDLQKRVEAVAMWRALNASAQDVLRDEARMQALESDIKKLGEVTARNLTTLKEVTGRLEVSESQRYANPLVYGLAVGLMACLAALGFMWQRLRKGAGGDQPWWGGAVDEPSLLQEDLADVQGPLVNASSQVPAEDFPATAVTKERRLDAAPNIAVDIDLEMGESVFAQPHVQPSQATALRHSDAQPSAYGALRSINTKEMLDVRQQAEFFMTLGQYDEAITMLESSIKASTESNPLVYLDLLKALHTLSRKSDFEAYRSEFNHTFAGVVPPYAQFNQAGRGLEAYPDVCQQIVALWPSEAVVHFMEKCMVRAPGNALDQGLDIDAFRELLLLHAIAKRLPSGATDSGLVPFSTVREMTAGSAPVFDRTDSMPVAAIPSTDGPASADIDFDLSDPRPADNLIDFDITGYPPGDGKSGATGS